MSALDSSPYSTQIATANQDWIYTVRRLCADGTAIYQTTTSPDGSRLFHRVKFLPDLKEFSILESFNEMPDKQPGDEALLTAEVIDDKTVRFTF